MIFAVDHGMGEGPPKNHSTFVGPLKGLNIQTLITFVLLGLLGLFVGLACVLSALHTVKTGHVGKLLLELNKGHLAYLVQNLVIPYNLL